MEEAKQDHTDCKHEEAEFFECFEGHQLYKYNKACYESEKKGNFTDLKCELCEHDFVCTDEFLMCQICDTFTTHTDCPEHGGADGKNCAHGHKLLLKTEDKDFKCSNCNKDRKGSEGFYTCGEAACNYNIDKVCRDNLAKPHKKFNIAQTASNNSDYEKRDYKAKEVSD